MGEIVQQKFGNSKVDVHLKNGLYLVYMNPATKMTYPVTDPNMPPPAGAFPKTYLSEEAVQGDFPYATLNVVGIVKNSERVVGKVSEQEVRSFLSESEEDGVQVREKSDPVHAGSDLFLSKLMDLFRASVLQWKFNSGKGGSKRNIEMRGFVNGIAKSILSIYPELEGELRDIVEGEEDNGGFLF